MRILLVLAVMIPILLASGIACGGDEEEARVMPSPASEGEGETEEGNETQEVVREQVDRMDEIIEHQLQRAAVSGRATLARSVPIRPLLERLVSSLDKVYGEKAVRVRLDVAEEATFYGDEADLTEVLGNLLENAYKYGKEQINVAVHCDPKTSAGHAVDIQIGDDGPGIDPAMIDAVLQRGRRMDETVPGHGIGLSIVQEIVAAYGGKLEIERSELGGALLRVRFDS